MPSKSSDPSPPADLESLRRSLNAEHLARKEAEAALSEVRQQAKAEALASSRAKLAAAEFRAAASGRVRNAAEAFEMLNVDLLTTPEGDPIPEAIEKAVAAFEAVWPANPPEPKPTTPAPSLWPMGVRQSAPSRDWLRNSIAS